MKMSSSRGATSKDMEDQYNIFILETIKIIT